MRFKKSELFAIPCGELFGLEDQAVQVLYSPFRDEIALVDRPTVDALAVRYEGQRHNIADETVQELMEAFHQDEVTTLPTRDIRQTTRLSVIPNLTCNFSCSYCYSAQGRSSTVLDERKIRAALDYFISRDRLEPCHLSLFITGGGEPLATWPLTGGLIDYARQRAKAEGFGLSVSVITNGSLVTPEIAAFLHRHDCTVGVSFEVLEDLQDSQRKMWQRVRDNIFLLHREGVRVKLNSTITPQSVQRMEEMVACVARDYPFVAQYTMEPVTGAGLFESAARLRSFYDDFFQTYARCSAMARRKGIPLRFTFDDEIRGVTPRHCLGKFCLTPTGKISVCHLVSSPQEARFADCVYGEVTDEGQVRIDDERFGRLYDRNVCSYAQCLDCFAKWDCGGECMTRRDTYPADYLDEVCRFNRRFVRYRLLQTIGNTLEQEQGLTLEQYVRNEME